MDIYIHVHNMFVCMDVCVYIYMYASLYDGMFVCMCMHVLKFYLSFISSCFCTMVTGY
jgi:hypothetical protein